MYERPFAVRAKVPMMVNCRVEIDRGEDGGEAIDRLVRGIDRIRTFPDLVPPPLKGKLKLVTGSFDLMIHPAELQRQRNRGDPIQEVKPDQHADQSRGRNGHTDCLTSRSVGVITIDQLSHS